LIEIDPEVFVNLEELTTCDLPVLLLAHALIPETVKFLNVELV
jgi:hypothetical protein